MIVLIKVNRIYQYVFYINIDDNMFNNSKNQFKVWIFTYNY